MSYNKSCVFDVINFRNKDAVRRKSFKVSFERKKKMQVKIIKIYEIFKAIVGKYGIIS